MPQIEAYMPASKAENDDGKNVVYFRGGDAPEQYANWRRRNGFT